MSDPWNYSFISFVWFFNCLSQEGKSSSCYFILARSRSLTRFFPKDLLGKVFLQIFIMCLVFSFFLTSPCSYKNSLWCIIFFCSIFDTLHSLMSTEHWRKHQAKNPHHKIMIEFIRKNVSSNDEAAKSTCMATENPLAVPVTHNMLHKHFPTSTLFEGKNNSK